MSNLLIKNGQLIDPANNINQLADLHIINGKIAAIEPANTIKASDNSQTVDASHLIIIPGLVDCCARLREPGLEHKATLHSETIAAAKAGITTLCCPPDTEPVIDEPAVVELINQKTANTAHSNVVTLGALTAGLHGKHLSEINALKQTGCVGLSNCRKPIENSLILKRAFAYAATLICLCLLNPMTTG